MSASFQYFRRGACPVCGGAAKGCRQSKATLDIFCRSKQNTGLNGWGWIRTDKHGFGIYRDTAQTPEQQQAAARALEEQQRRQREKQAGLLPNTERDAYYRRIARHTGLGSASRQELRRRGLTKDQIDFAIAQGWLSDWQRGSCSNLNLNSAIAGVHPKTGQLTGVDGLAIYASDLNGNITGAQVRPAAPFIREELGKYLWLSSNRAGGNGPQLRSGHLPLFVFKHPDFNPALPCQIEAAEGSLKPLIHALRLWDDGEHQQTIVIGAASGHFAGLDSVLQQLSHLQSFTLHADAGAQDNPDFRRKYPQALVQVAQAHPASQASRAGKGIDLSIGWWGQTDKQQHLDIDELSSEQRRQIQRISVFEWLQFGTVSTAMETSGGEANSREPRDTPISRGQWRAKFAPLVAHAALQQEKAERQVLLPSDQTGLHRTLERMCRNAWESLLPSSIKRSTATQSISARNNGEQKTPTSTALVPWTPPIDPVDQLVITEETVPTFAEWQAHGYPRLQISGEPAPVLLKLVELGYESVLLDDVVGSGKSHVAGAFLQAWQEQQAWRSQVERQRAFYYASDYKNPSTPTLEAIPETPTGGALNYDHEHLTPAGKPHRKRAPTGTKNPDIAALCIEDENIQAARAKGMELFRGSDQPICRNCSIGTKNCPYLREAGKIQEESALRSHLSKGGSGTVALVDEAGQQLQSTRRITAKPTDLDGEIAWINDEKPDLYRSIERIAQRLKQGLDRAVAERGRYGLTHAELLNFLPTQMELEQLHWQALGDKLLQRSDDPWAWPDLETVVKTLMGALQPNTEQLLRGQSVIGKAHQIEYFMTPAVLPRLMTLLMGYRGDVALTPTGLLTFSYPDPRQQRTLSHFATVFLMDATPDARDLARQLGIAPQHLTRVSWAAPTFDNLTIKIVQGMGKATQQRRHDGEYSEQRRLNYLVQHLADQTLAAGQLTGLLDLKAHVSHYSEMPLIRGHQFAHSRGSNAFKGCTQLVIIAGNARENLGAALAQWHMHTGKACTIETAPHAFWNWVERRARANLLQANGRTRGQHRPETPITHYIVGEISEADIAALQTYFTGCTVEWVHAYDICPQAASQGYQSDRAIATAMWAATERREHTTINQIAATTGMSKGNVSKRIANLLETGGYRVFREGFQLLYRALNSDGKLIDLPEQVRWIAQEYLPGLAAELREQQEPVAETTVEIAADVLETLSILGDDAQTVLAAVDINALAILLGALVQALPAADQGVIDALKPLLRPPVMAVETVPLCQLIQHP